MKTLYTEIKNLITMEGAAKKKGRHVGEEDFGLIRDGAFLVSEEGKIEWTGPASSAPTKDVRVVALKAQTVLPAFIECHTHSIFAGQRFQEFEEIIQGVSYQEISKKGGGIRLTMKATREASEEELKSLLQKRVTEFRRQGVSTVEVKTGYGLSLKEELRLLRVIQSLGDPFVMPTFLGPHGSSPEHENLESYLKELMEKALPQVAAEKLAARADIFVEKGFFTKEQAHRYFQAARDLGLRLSVHAEQLSHSGGIQEAVAFQAASVDHCVNASAEDLRQLAASETTAVLLPSADFYLNIGYPPARLMIDQGVRVALSTDFNPGSSPSQSLELCSLLARVMMKMTLPEIFSAWTVGAAHVLGVEERQGSLQPGKQADFSVWDKSWNAFFYDFDKNRPKDLYLLGKRVAFL
jgi:imidazolonepropionase